MKILNQIESLERLAGIKKNTLYDSSHPDFDHHHSAPIIKKFIQKHLSAIGYDKKEINALNNDRIYWDHGDIWHHYNSVGDKTIRDTYKIHPVSGAIKHLKREVTIGEPEEDSIWKHVPNPTSKIFVRKID